MTTSLESFFAGGGGHSVSWKDKPLGSNVTGTITGVGEPRQQTDPVDGSLVFQKDKVTPKMSVRIDLDTNFRNFEMIAPLTAPPTEPDDGARALYVQGSLQYAIGDALRKAGRQGPPEVGGTLSVTLVERVPNENRALNPTNKFNVTYTSPAPAAQQAFFDQAGQQAGAAVAQQFAAANPGYPVAQPPQQFAPPAPVYQQAPPQQAPVPQPSINGQGYIAAPTGAGGAGAGAGGGGSTAQFVPTNPAPGAYAPPVPQQAAVATIERPTGISEQAWATMDPTTQANVAATMSQLPPF